MHHSHRLRCKFSTLSLHAVLCYRYRIRDTFSAVLKQAVVIPIFSRYWASGLCAVIFLEELASKVKDEQHPTIFATL